MMARQQIRHEVKPDVAYLHECGKLLLKTEEMARFVQLPTSVVQQLVYSDRIPLPLHIGLGKTARWSVFELLQWTEAGCPRRTQWIEMRGSSGWCPAYRWGRWWQ